MSDVRRGDEAERVASELAARVFDLMARDRVSAASLAEDAGIAPNTIRQVINASGNVTLWTLASIAAALGCRLVIDFTEVDT